MKMHGIEFSFWQDTSFGVCAIVILATVIATPIGGIIAYVGMMANMAKREKNRLKK